MNEHWIKYDLTTGIELARGFGPPGTAAIQYAAPGQAVLALPEAALPPYEPADTEAVRAALWAVVKARRTALIDGGAETPSGRVDTDPESRLNIVGATTGATAAAQLGAPFAVTWTLADNTLVELDGPEMMAVGLAVLQHVSAVHDHARDLRDEITAAATLNYLLMIDTGAGWPE